MSHLGAPHHPAQHARIVCWYVLRLCAPPLSDPMRNAAWSLKTLSIRSRFTNFCPSLPKRTGRLHGFQQPYLFRTCFTKCPTAPSPHFINACGSTSCSLCILLCVHHALCASLHALSRITAHSLRLCTCLTPYLVPDSTLPSMLGMSLWGMPVPLSCAHRVASKSSIQTGDAVQHVHLHNETKCVCRWSVWAAGLRAHVCAHKCAHTFKRVCACVQLCVYVCVPVLSKHPSAPPAAAHRSCMHACTDHSACTPMWPRPTRYTAHGTGG